MSRYICLKAATALLCAGFFIGIHPLKAVNSLGDTTGNWRSEDGWEILDLSTEAATPDSLRFEDEWVALGLLPQAQRHIPENDSCAIGSDWSLALDPQSGSQDTDDESVPTVQSLLLMGVSPQLLSGFDACDAAKANASKESDLLRAFIAMTADLRLSEETKAKLCNDLIAFKRRAYQDEEHLPSETRSLIIEYFKHKYAAAYTQKDTELHPVVDAAAQVLETFIENVSKHKLLALARTLSQPSAVISSEDLLIKYRDRHHPRWIQEPSRQTSDFLKECGTVYEFWDQSNTLILRELWGHQLWRLDNGSETPVRTEEVVFYREGQSVTAPVSIDYGALFEPVYIRLLLEAMMRFPSIGEQDPFVVIKDAQWQTRSQRSWTGHHKL